MNLSIFRKVSPGILPNLIIIGGVKCATTSLHYYLDLHPQISMSGEKELDFFIVERNWHRGVEWYKSRFRGQAVIYGEASPDYTYFPRFRGVPERMSSVIPDAKLIYIVRDPIERVISHYVHRVASGIEKRSIEEALIELEANFYVNCSLYTMQLEHYLNYFPQNQILVIQLEDLFRRRQNTMQKIFRYLGVDETFYSPRFSRVKHPSAHKRDKTHVGDLLAQTRLMSLVKKLPYNLRGKAETLLYFPLSRKIQRPILDQELRLRLTSHFEDDIKRLKTYTDSNFEEWFTKV